MKQTKRYLAGLLAVLMLIGSIHMGGMAIDVKEEVKTDEVISSEEMEIEEVDIEEIEEVEEKEQEEKQEISTGSGNSVISSESTELNDSVDLSESNDSNNLNESELDESNESTESEEPIPSNDSVSDNNISFEESDKNTNEVETDDTNISVEENSEVDLSETDSNETEEGETDNWELGLVFYDSSVDNGKTPLTEINWDASDGGYSKGESRVITVQINYSNTNTMTTYQPGELKIKLENFCINLPRINYSIIIGANDNEHTGYEWNFISNKNDKNYYFTNENIIDEKSNFEGTIQIVYNLIPQECFTEQFDDECIKLYYKDITSQIIDIKNNIIIDSNILSFDYKRRYSHPWKYSNYKVKQVATKILSYDGLSDDANNYIWVKYGFSYDGFFNYHSPYPYIYAKNETGIYKNKIPSECLVYDTNGNLLKADSDGFYNIKSSGNYEKDYIYVGYPKFLYNEENNNLNITNEVELWGIYFDNINELQYLSSSTININLIDFQFTYNGNLYKIYKENSNTTNTFRYQDIINEGSYNKSQWRITPNCIYSGKPMTIKIGDDLLFSTTQDNRIEKLNDEEFFYSRIEFNPSKFVNGNRNPITNEKYNCELYVRYKNSNEYILYESFKNPSVNKLWKFSKEDGIVGFYFMIYDMKESLNPYINDAYNRSLINIEIVFLKKDIPKSGILYNFDYLQVYFKDNDGNLILQNEPNLDSYATFITKEKISQFDQDTYGVFLQRDTESLNWSYYDVEQKMVKIQSRKILIDGINQNEKEKIFTGKFKIGCAFQHQDIDLYYKEQYNGTTAFEGFKIYDLLPNGMEITSTSEEIKSSLELNNSYFNKDKGVFYDLFFNELTYKQVLDLMNVNVNIIKNWKNSNRTKLEIIVTFNEPLYVCIGSLYSDSRAADNYIDYSFNFKISYDSFLEYGGIYKNTCYVQHLENYNGTYSNSKKDILDLNEDGSIEDECSEKTVEATITSVISTHQEITKQVKTDKSSYLTGVVESSYDSEYEYKLRVKTGQNDVTNLIIYDSIEEYTQDSNGDVVPAYGTKQHWNGTFLGIDTSYAESKGYIVKPYYSENVLAENLYNTDDSLNSDWKEYYNPVKPVYTNGLKIKFSNSCTTYSSSDYVYIYYYEDGKYYCSQKLYGTNIKNKEIEIPSTNFYLYWHTESSSRNYYGFSIDSIEPISTENVFTSTITSLPNYEIIKLDGENYPESLHNPYNTGTTNLLWYYTGEKIMLEEGYDVIDMNSVKSLAFEYLDSNGNPAILPANSLTYVLIKMKSPADESITSMAYNGCRTQWQALDEFNQPVDFITGINSNIVKVSLPNSGRGSYIVKHEYYMRDYNGNLILENTYLENEVSNIVIDTIIKAEEQNHIEENNNKQYIFTEDSGDIAIKENEVSEIVLKYIRDEEYGSYQVKHEYYVKEKMYTNALAITFNSKCAGESATYDYIELYYKKEDKTYKLGKYRANDLAGKTITIPSSDFYLYWRTDGSGSNYYGFSIDKIETVESNEIIGTKVTSLPNYEIIELNKDNYPESEHNPYKNNSNLLWHYTGERKVTDKYQYTLENTVLEEIVPNIVIGTTIKADEQNHIENNNEKQYVFTEDTGDIIVEKDTVSEITIKYVREEEYGSYVVKHEYYIRDFDGNLTLENTYSENEIPDIIVGTIIKADEQEHILSNDEKEYAYLENTGDITIKKDTVSEITMKYVRDEEYTAELPNSGGRGNDWILFNVIFFSLVGSSLFFIANKKRKN